MNLVRHLLSMQPSTYRITCKQRALFHWHSWTLSWTGNQSIYLHLSAELSGYWRNQWVKRRVSKKNYSLGNVDIEVSTLHLNLLFDTLNYTVVCYYYSKSCYGINGVPYHGSWTVMTVCHVCVDCLCIAIDCLCCWFSSVTHSLIQHCHSELTVYDHDV